MRYVVTGAPRSGKTTWASEHARPGTLVWDADAVERALNLSGTLDVTLGAPGTEAPRPLTEQLYDTVVAYLRRTPLVPAIVIRTDEREAGELAVRIGATLVTLDPGESVCEDRCGADAGRRAAVRRWYRNRRATPTTGVAH